MSSPPRGRHWRGGGDPSVAEPIPSPAGYSAWVW
uniref:Uncharacterized protein n=1 Tax=Arundo donax TaxID=35708 RepID=A0A0A9ENW1_ARUDO